MSDYHQKRAVEIIKKIQYATLATVTPEGMPWNSPVKHEYDNDLNVYWASDKEGQHSKNVQANGNVFIVIYDSTVPEGDGEGVYIQATVTALSEPEEIKLVRRIKKGPEVNAPADEFLGDAVRRMYKASPQKVWMNDAEITDGVFIRDFRVEIDLEKLRKDIYKEGSSPAA
jgi:nitroimidazol reductase NimA-like FMN-containing flavoprotein (pyridoxamine 5'-phosphate oxidase superfamily)